MELEQNLRLQVSETNIMKKNIKALEDKADTYKMNPGNWSADRNVRLRIKTKRGNIFDKLLEMEEMLESNEREIAKLRIIIKHDK